MYAVEQEDNVDPFIIVGVLALHGPPIMGVLALHVLNSLNDISPHFMPRPLGKSDEGRHHFDVKDMNATHKKLINIYKKCNYYMHIPRPFGEDYEEHISKQVEIYKSSKNTIVSYIKYLKELLWNHAAMGLDYTPNGDKLSSVELSNTKNAWIVDFCEPKSNKIKMVVAIAEQAHNKANSRGLPKAASLAPRYAAFDIQ